MPSDSTCLPPSCPRCTKPLPPTARVCGFCGSPVSVLPLRVQTRAARPATPAFRDPLLGKTLAGRFRVEELIGQGGMGRVYRARHLALDRPVVLKVLKPSLLEDPTLVGRFEREAKAASRLSHPNVIRVLDFGRSDPDGSLFIAMELLTGKDLRAVLRDEWPLPEKRLRGIVAQLCAALAEAHAHNVIHRDLKPENIMLEQRRDRPDHVTVLDFGIARILDADLPRLTRSDVVCGTPQYMAPEQATGTSLDARCDLYAVGVILYQLATGSLPFDGASSMEVLTKQVHEQPVPPREKSPTAPISPALEALILRALEKDPALRPQTARELEALLLDEREAPKAAAPVKQDLPAAPRRKRLPLALAAGLAVVLVAAAGLSRFAWRTGDPKVAIASPVPGESRGDEARDLVRRAVEWEAANEPATAIALLEKAVALDPGSAEAHYRLGALLLRSEPGRAARECEEARRLDPARYAGLVTALLRRR